MSSEEPLYSLEVLRLRRSLAGGDDVKMRDLTRRAGTRTVPAWPPRWAGSFHSGAVLLGDGVLVSVTHANNTELRLTMEFHTNKYTGILKWDRPPALDAVEKRLKANLGRAIGDLDV